MSKREIYEAKAEELVLPLVEANNFELVDVEYVKENGGMSLIFVIDNDAGVTVDDCEIVSRKIDPMLDELNPTGDKAYTLVVSSPGLERPLKTERDFKRASGKEVELNLFSKIDGKKNFVGVLKSYDEKTVTLLIDEEEIKFDREKVASIKLVIKF